MCKLIRNKLLLRYIWLTIIFAFFAVMWHGEKEGIIFFILGGIKNDMGKQIELLPMGKWLFLFGYFFMIIGMQLARERQSVTLLMHRYGSFYKWWRTHFINIEFLIMILFLSSICIWKCMEFVYEVKSLNFIWICVTYFIHLICMGAVEISSDILFSSKVMSAILIILEGILYILSIQYSLPWLAAGMFVRSDKYQKDGYSILLVYIIEVFIIAICYLAVPVLWKCGWLERREIWNGKSD